MTARIAPMEPPYDPEVKAALDRWMPPGSGVEPLLLADRGVAGRVGFRLRYRRRFAEMRGRVEVLGAFHGAKMIIGTHNAK